MNKCDYCGQDNVSDAVRCAGCGTYLNEPPEPPRPPKSKTTAVILALIFGPLGLLYLGLEGVMVFLFVIGIAIFTLPFLLTALHGTGFGLLITLVVRALCASWAIQTLNRRNSEEMDEPEAAILLDEGVKLENVDFDQAIAKYEELIEKFPNSAESKTARTCVETLKANLKRNPASQ